MEWIYLSPHLDDIALSCGGLVWEQAINGERAAIWSICAGDPPDVPLSSFANSLHQRWKTGSVSTEERRREDAQSCAYLTATHRHFLVPDCIYRRSPQDGHPLYDSEEAIFGPLDSVELPLVEEVCTHLEQIMPEGATLVSPLAIGGHVDHRLAREAAERLGKSLWYYADYPYVERPGAEINPLLPTAYEKVVFKVSEKGMQAWFDSVAAHRTQISTFWPDLQSMQLALAAYYAKHGGVRLWKPVSSNS